MSDDERPIVAMTLGDPAGVGPEIVAGLLSGGAYASECRVLIVGSRETFDRAAQLRGLENRA